MAEFVQFRLEENLPELQLMLKMKLFDESEIRKIIRRVTTFEYRLQRSHRTKKDYLKYIEYQLNLLKLIRLRRKRAPKRSKRKDIENMVAYRIRGLYKRLLDSNKSDVKVWLAFIEFSESMKWKSSMGELYASMLKFHTKKPGVWVAAANWEFEENASVKVARKTLLRGLRFNQDSKLIYQELFELELRNADIELKVAEEEKEERKAVATNEADDLDSRPSTALKLAEIVYKNAVDVIKDVEFAVSLLNICDRYNSASPLSESMCTDLQEKFGDNELWRKTWAERPLNLENEATNPESDVKIKAEDCVHRYEDAVKCLATEKMWTFYIEFCLKRLTVNPIEHTLDVFSRAAQDRCLSPTLFQQWASMASQHDDQLCSKVLRYATKRYSTMSVLWEERIRHCIKVGASNVKINKIIEKGLTSVPPKELLTIWKMALYWRLANDPAKVEPFFEAGVLSDPVISSHIKIMYVEWVLSERGYEAAWELYKRIWSIPPVCLELFRKIQEIIEDTPTPSIKRLRRVMRSARSNFGETSVDVWIESLKIETKYSETEDSHAARVYEQAIKTLAPHLVDQFITYHTLQNTKVLDCQ